MVLLGAFFSYSDLTSSLSLIQPSLLKNLIEGINISFDQKLSLNIHMNGHLSELLVKKKED